MSDKRRTTADLVDRLRQFMLPTARGHEGLRDDSIQIYVEILGGPVLTRDLDMRFGLAVATDARRQLSRWALAFEYNTPTGRTVSAIPPQQAWTARAADFTWTVQITPDLLHELRATGIAAVDTAHQLCLEIATLASRLYVDPGGVGVSRRTALKSADQIAVALSQLFHVAQSHVIAMSKGPRLPHLAIIWEAIERRLIAKELRYTRLVQIDELLAHGLAIVRRDVMRAGVQLRVGSSTSVNATFYIVDGSTMLVHESLERGQIVTQRRALNGSAQKLDRALKKSADALDIVDVLQARATDLVGRASRIGNDESLLLQRKIANGRFALPPDGWTPTRVGSAERRLRHGRLVAQSDDGVWLPNYNVSFESGIAELEAGTIPAQRDVCPSCWCVSDLCYCDST